MSGKRWKALAFYRTKNGLVDVQHDIEELEYLADVIERGPHWAALDRIEITLERDLGMRGITIEETEKL